MISRANLPTLIFAACLFSLAPNPAAAGYAMYVWTTGFDATVAGCDETKLEAWDKLADPECYTHNWDTPESRQWLWDTANRPGREIDRLFVSDIKSRLQTAYEAGDCSDPEVQAIKAMLVDGHCEVPGVAIHALFATSDVAVSEQNHVPYVVWYNDNCAGSPNARFDGIAVNNEAWGDIKCSGPAVQQAYLDDLQAVADAADQQVTGDLATHYSIGWHWGQCSGLDVTVDWSGTIQPATHHMIEIFDSVDVQVATVSASTASDRVITAGYGHALGLGKPFYVLSYTNKAADSDCSTTHFPYFCSYTWSNPRRNDDYLMEQIFDAFPANGIPDALPAIHYFRGVYSSGGHSDWPSYYSGSLTSCIPVAFQGPVTFANPDDDDEISWPAQGDATVYELARADSPRFDTGCRLLATTSETVAVDRHRPDPSSVFFYLVRVVEPEAFDWGETSGGIPRDVTCQ